MLDENKAEQKRLEIKYKEMALKKAKSKYVRSKYKKYFIISIFVTLGFFIFCYPIETGTLIGNWIHSFFGTIIEVSKNG